jgi:hypothetical protein
MFALLTNSVYLKSVKFVHVAGPSGFIEDFHQISKATVALSNFCFVLGTLLISFI